MKFVIKDKEFIDIGRNKDRSIKTAHTQSRHIHTYRPKTGKPLFRKSVNLSARRNTPAQFTDYPFNYEESLHGKMFISNRSWSI